MKFLRIATVAAPIVLGAAALVALFALVPTLSAAFLAIFVLWSTYAAVRLATGGAPLVLRRRTHDRARDEGGPLPVGDVAGFGEQLRDTPARYGYAVRTSS